MIHQLRGVGLCISEIARQFNLDRKTVRKHLGVNWCDVDAIKRTSQSGQAGRLSGLSEVSLGWPCRAIRMTAIL